MSDALILGFTGSRNGLTANQHQNIFEGLQIVKPVEVHHGDCVGADAQFHAICYSLFPDIRFVIHPPKNEKLRAFCKAGNVTILPAKDYLQRDLDIVLASHRLWGAPSTDKRAKGSGTWATIGYGLAYERPTMLFAPDGIMRWLP